MREVRNVVYLQEYNLNKATAAVLITPRGHDTRKVLLMHSDHTTRPEPIKLCECGCGEATPLAKMTSTKFGRIKGQPLRFVPTHHGKAPRSSESLQRRFWQKVDVRGADECWEWTGSRDEDGYGRIDHNGKHIGAHRLSYELHYGPIADGMLIRHSCSNRPCCNPKHLLEGTAADNNRDTVEQGRSLKGSKHHNAKLKESDIPVIRKLVAEGFTYKDIGERYGVTASNIYYIVNRKAWQHVP